MQKSHFGIWLLALCLLGFATSSFGQSYRILITNDDGIESPLLAALKRALETLDDVEVLVVAPNVNQSGSSNSSVGSPLVVDQVYRDGQFFGYAVHGRPADAVTFAINQLGTERKFDLVVSGINAGANVGNVSHGSGTVGAAMRAVYLGLPAIAVSQNTRDVDTQRSARFAATVVEKVRADSLPPDTVLSINIPGGDIKGVMVRPMGESYLGRSPYRVVAETENSTTYESSYVIVQAENSDTDTFAYQQGYITLTPLKFDWTAYDYIPVLESWNLQ